MMSNPIIRKEVLSALRTRKAAAMQVVFLLVVAGLIWLLWPAGGLQDIGAQQARRLFSVLAIGELVLIALFAPTFTAASLTLEKERNTWESLFATTMKPWEIAVGKMVGSLSFLMLVTLTGIVGLAMPVLLGGVSIGDVLAAVGLLLMTAVYLGMIGLLVSILTHRSYRAIIITYAILLALMFLTALPVWPVSKNLLSRQGPAVQKVLHTIASLSPLQAMLSLVLPDTPYTTGAAGMPAFWQVFLVAALLVAAVTTVLCLYTLHRPIAPPRPRERLQVVERGQITARTFLFLIDPRKRKRAIGWWQNPVLVKEFRTRPMLQAHWLLRAILICLITSILLMFLVAVGIGTLASESVGTYTLAATVVAAMMVSLIVLIGPAMTSGAICSDLETGVWDLMCVTRLASWRIASGKFQASIIPLLLLAGATLPAMVILLFFDVNLLPNVLRVAAVAGTTVVFVATCGLFFSSVCKKTSTATAWTYSVIISLAMVTLLVLLGSDLFSDRFIGTVFLLNPIAAAMDAAGYPPMQQYDLVASHLKLMLLATAGLFVVTVFRVFQLRGAK